MITGFKKTMLASAVAAMLSLTGCGGGGGSAPSSSAITPPPTPTSPPAPTTAAEKATVDQTTYRVGSAEDAAFKLLNKYRTQCGFLPAKENTILDQAALNHAIYQQLNNGPSDYENTGNPGFTGVTPMDRAKNAGWDVNAGVSQVSNMYYYPVNTPEKEMGETAIKYWFSGVYHIFPLFIPPDMVGLGFDIKAYNNSTMQASGVAIEAQYPIRQSSGSNTPLTFPCEGVSGIFYRGSNELPTPPSDNGTWGTPVAVVGNSLFDKISIDSATISPAGGQPVKINILNSTNDPNHNLQPYVAVAYPTSPLSPLTSYSVHIVGKMNGVGFTREFTFTTGT